jgi:hypothetical protein
MKALFSILFLGATLSASGCGYETLSEHPCPPGGTTLTYENFGEGFFDSYCNSCHSAPDSERNGAPDDDVFATVDDVRQHADRIFVRAAGPNTSMPPGPDDPPETERDKLADWLACGAP